MRGVYRVLAGLVALGVVVQAASMVYAVAGLGKWVEDDGGVLNKQLLDSENAEFPGVGGFMTHGINGTTLIPLIVLLLLIVSFFTKMAGATRRAAILFGLVAVQVFLGIFSHELPAAIVLHALNAFAIFVLAGLTARSVGAAPAAHAPAASQASVPV